MSQNSVSISSLVLLSAGIASLSKEVLQKIGQALSTAEKTFGKAGATSTGTPIEPKKAGCIVLTSTSCVIVSNFYRYSKGTGGQLDTLFRDTCSPLGFSVETCRFGGGNWTKALDNIKTVEYNAKKEAKRQKEPTPTPTPEKTPEAKTPVTA